LTDGEEGEEAGEHEDMPKDHEPLREQVRHRAVG